MLKIDVTVCRISTALVGNQKDDVRKFFFGRQGNEIYRETNSKNYCRKITKRKNDRADRKWDILYKVPATNCDLEISEISIWIRTRLLKSKVLNISFGSHLPKEDPIHFFYTTKEKNYANSRDTQVVTSNYLCITVADHKMCFCFQMLSVSPFTNI